MENKVDALIVEFSQIASLTSEKLRSIDTIINDGRVPKKELVDSVDESITKLQSLYDDIYSITQSSVGESDLPDYGASVGEYREAIHSSRNAVLHSQVDSIQTILNKFIAVRTALDSNPEELIPYKKSATELKSLLSSASLENIDDLIERSRASEDFIEIIEKEEHDDSVIERVNDNYPAKIVYKLYSKQYFIGDDEYQSRLKSETNINDEKTTVSESVNEPTVLVQQKSNPGNSNNEGMYLLPINTPKLGVTKANAFKNDLDKMGNMFPKLIIPMLSNLGVMTETQIVSFALLMDFGNDPDSMIDKLKYALNRLIDKGFVLKYEINPENYCYCLASYTYMCIHKESLKNSKQFWACNIADFTISLDRESRLNSVLANNIVTDNSILLSYLSVVKNKESKQVYSSIQSSLRRNNGTYQIKALIEGVEYNCDLYNGRNENRDKPVIVVPDIKPLEESFEIVIICSDGELIIAKDSSPSENSDNHEADTFVDVSKIETPIVDNSDFSDENADYEAAPQLESSESESDWTNEQTVNSTNNEHLTGTSRVIPPLFSDNSFAQDAPSEEEFMRIIEGIINVETNDNDSVRSAVVNGVVMAQAASFIDGYNDVLGLFNQLLYSTDLPLDDRQYSSISISSVFVEPSQSNECLLMSTYLYALLCPTRPYDYGISAQVDQFIHNYETYFPSLEALKSLFNKLININKELPSGFTPSIVALLSDEIENDKYLRSIQNTAKEYLTVPNVKTKMKALNPLYHTIFGEKSDLYYCLTIVSNNIVDQLDNVKILLLDFCEENDDELSIDESKIDDFVNQSWYNENPGNKFDLDYVAKKRVLKNTNLRISILKSWYDFHTNTRNQKYDLERLKTEKNWLINESNKALDKLSDIHVPYVNVLKWMLIHITQYLNGTVDNLWIFSDFLCSGVFMFDENRVPIIDSEYNAVKYYEPWRNMQNHLNSSIHDLSEARTCINENADSIMFDNINQLKLINSYLGGTTSIEDEETIVNKAKDIEARFREKLELSYLYSQISEVEKESLSQIVDQHREVYYTVKDFGCWKQFLQALEQEIKELSQNRQAGFKASLEEYLSSFEDEDVPSILVEANKLLCNPEEPNLAVVEELINRYDSGEHDFSEEWNTPYEEETEFQRFISDEVFIPLHDACKNYKSKALKSFGKEIIKKFRPKEWTSRLIDESEELVNNWPMSNEKNASKIRMLFEHLGFNVIDISKRIPMEKGDRYQLYVKPTPLGLSDYSHPISKFGTQMNSHLDVVILHGGHNHKEIVDRVTALDLGGIAIVLLDFPFTISERRLLSEYFHTQTSRQNPFILIDQTLFLYLAMHQKTERIPVMLSCTLPFTTYQPFVIDGGSTSNEMFFGRVKELSSIIDPNGAVVVYGGRQLGKTALLQRAEKRCMNPERKEYAVYVSVLTCDTESKFVKRIIEKANSSINSSEWKFADCQSLEEFVNEIEKNIKIGRIDKLWLFIDEVDRFLASIADDGYMQLWPLIELKRRYSGQFKYVLAGLHNVCRAKKATANNGVFGQVGSPLCIKPLSPSDAIQLITRPLSYLGFEIDRLPHLLTILTKSNYYPGILQFFGYTLVQTLTSNYTKYYQANRHNPPFPLKGEHLGSVMDSADLNESIKKMFELSLELDPRYFMLARCIAFRYHWEDDNNRWLGYDVESIKEIADNYNIRCLLDTSNKEYIVLLDEMVDMGILSSQNGLYRLRKNSFIDLIGRDLNTVEYEIQQNND